MIDYIPDGLNIRLADLTKQAAVEEALTAASQMRLAEFAKEGLARLERGDLDLIGARLGGSRRRAEPRRYLRDGLLWYLDAARESSRPDESVPLSEDLRSAGDCIMSAMAFPHFRSEARVRFRTGRQWENLWELPEVEMRHAFRAIALGEFRGEIEMVPQDPVSLVTLGFVDGGFWTHVQKTANEDELLELTDNWKVAYWAVPESPSWFIDEEALDRLLGCLGGEGTIEKFPVVSDLLTRLRAHARVNDYGFCVSAVLGPT